jgi:hypothetical protein
MDQVDRNSRDKFDVPDSRGKDEPQLTILNLFVVLHRTNHGSEIKGRHSHRQPKGSQQSLLPADEVAIHSIERMSEIRGAHHSH